MDNILSETELRMTSSIENLEKRKIKIYRTDKMGEICIKITKKAIIKINTKLNTS